MFIRECNLEVSMTTLEIIIVFGFGLVCYLLWDIRKRLLWINMNIKEIKFHIFDSDRK